jgi:hypothetical protein
VTSPCPGTEIKTRFIFDKWHPARHLARSWAYRKLPRPWGSRCIARHVAQIVNASAVSQTVAGSGIADSSTTLYVIPLVTSEQHPMRIRIASKSSVT